MAGLPYRGATAAVANAVMQAINLAYRERSTVETIAALRAVGTAGASSTSALTPNALRYVTAALTCYRWDETSSAADDGASVVKPDDVDSSNPGRWRKATTSTLRLVDGTRINQATSGYLRNVVYYNGERSEDEFERRIYGQRPCVVVDFLDRQKIRKSTQQGGAAWATYRFQIDCISFCARPDERGFRGSFVTSESTVDPGAWAMAEDIEQILDGATGDDLGVDAISHCKVGALDVVENDLTGRKAVVSLDLEVYATIGKRDVDASALTGLSVQLETGIVRPAGEDVDADNVIISGLRIFAGSGLSHAPTNGSAKIDGETVTVSGAALHTFTANAVTYRDLATDGTFTYVEAALGDDEEPDVTDGCLRIGRTITDSSSVVSDALLAPTLRSFGDPFTIAP